MTSKKFSKAKPVVVGIDIGGTFTDIVVVLPDGRMTTGKRLSTTDDYARGIVGYLREFFTESSVKPSLVETVKHATTIATNAIIELKGAKTGLITTKGFRDLSEIRPLRSKHRPEGTFAANLAVPPPLVRRALRLELDERIDHTGRVLKALNKEEVLSVLRRIIDSGVVSLAVCLINSYVNPTHEKQIGELIRNEAPWLDMSLSCDVLPQILEYERTSTTIINAYIRPVVRHYLKSLEEGLKSLGVDAPLRIMQSSGGIMRSGAAQTMPVHIIESGPSAGVVGSAYFARKAGLKKLITLDMGGTTAKASMVENGNFEKSYLYNVGGGMATITDATAGEGYPIAVPSIDVTEVGAGGGSIVWVDVGGLLHVGPRSAGALPGPACYDLGGTLPTLTDANVVLGYINPHAMAQGSVKINPDRAYSSFKEHISGHIAMPLEEIAYGAHLIANANMARAVKAISTSRGKDVRDYTLLAFGGGGPGHAAELARSLGIKKVIIPPMAGLFSALGLVLAEEEHNYSRSFVCKLSKIDFSSLNHTFQDMESEAISIAREEGYEAREIKLQRYVDMRYETQTSELTIPLAQGNMDEQKILSVSRYFFRRYEKRYGVKDIGLPVEIVNLRVTVDMRSRTSASLLLGVDGTRTLREVAVRKAYFGKTFGFLDTQILERTSLSSEPVNGPLIVEDPDSTTVVPPDCTASLGKWGSIVIDIH